MKLADFKSWLKELTSSKLLFVCGPEDYYKHKTIEHLRTTLKEAEYISYSAEEIDLDKLRELFIDADTLSLFAEQKIIVIKNIDKANNSLLDELNTYFKQVASLEHYFILTATAFDARSSFYKLVKKQGKVLKHRLLYDNEAMAWIDYLLLDNNLSMEVRGKALLLDLIGTSIIAMNSELQKFAAFADSKKMIKYEDVLKITGLSRENSIFDLTDALGERDIQKALYLLNNIHKQGMHETVILSMIAKHFRNLLKIQTLLGSGANRNQIASECGIHMFFVDKYINSARKFKPKKLKSFFKAIIDTDFSIKSVNWDSKLLLENLIISI